jgi:hypothetical protein
MQLKPVGPQRGVSMMAVLFGGGLLVIVAIFAMKLIGPVTEYMTILKTVRTVKDAGQTVAEIQRAFDKAATIDDIKSIEGKDLDVTKDGNDVVINFKYEKVIPVKAPVFLLLRFEGSSRQ